eukprot:5141510-Prymnesium_polylepis.1
MLYLLGKASVSSCSKAFAPYLPPGEALDRKTRGFQKAAQAMLIRLDDTEATGISAVECRDVRVFGKKAQSDGQVTLVHFNAHGIDKLPHKDLQGVKYASLVSATHKPVDEPSDCVELTLAIDPNKVDGDNLVQMVFSSADLGRLQRATFARIGCGVRATPSKPSPKRARDDGADPAAKRHGARPAKSTFDFDDDTAQPARASVSPRKASGRSPLGEASNRAVADVSDKAS